MKRLGISLLWGIGGSIVVAFAGCFLVQQFSSNQHDRSVEAAMSSVFFYGSIGTIVAFIVGFIRGGDRKISSPAER